MNQEAQVTGHISKRFDQELEDIRNQVLTMGGLVETQVNNGIKALVESDSKAAESVVATDHKVNRMEVDIDERCVQILARRQPAAGWALVCAALFLLPSSSFVPLKENMAEHRAYQTGMWLALAAVRDNTEAAKSVGVDAGRMKWIVFLTSAFGTGLAGGLIYMQKKTQKKIGEKDF